MMAKIKRWIALAISVLMLCTCFIGCYLTVQALESVTQQADSLHVTLLETIDVNNGLEQQLDNLRVDIQTLETSLEQMGNTVEEQRGNISFYETAIRPIGLYGQPLDVSILLGRNCLPESLQLTYDQAMFRVNTGRGNVSISAHKLGLNDTQSLARQIKLGNAVATANGWSNTYSYWPGQSYYSSIALGSAEQGETIVAVREVATPIIEAAMQLETDVEKIKYVHDWMVNNISYRLGNPGVYDALVNGVAHCEGYAITFGMFMNELGIPNAYVTGTAGGGSHAWNIVEVDGECYNIDVTWDDPIGGALCYDYFLISDTSIVRTHRRLSTDVIQLPECNNTQFESIDWFSLAA